MKALFPGGNGQYRAHNFLCEAEIGFPHVRHITFIYTEIHLPIYCPVTWPLKVKKNSSWLALVLSALDSCVSSANFVISLLILFSR